MLHSAKEHINNSSYNNFVIVHIVESFAGGTFEFLVNLTKNLSEFHHVIIHGKRNETIVNYQSFFPTDVEFIYWQNAERKISLVKDIKALIELFKILRRIKKINIIHVHSSKAGFLGRLAALITGKRKKVIYTPHGISFFRKDVSLFKTIFYVFLEFIASFMCNIIVCCSQSEKDFVKKYFIKNVLVIENGVFEYKENKITSIKETDKFIVATMGRITPAKNPELFNEIAYHIKDDKQIKFIWIGDGENRQSLKSENIFITGWLSANKALRKLSECDIYLSTSLWEGLPLSVLSAMAEAKPVVLTKCAGNIDVNKCNNALFYDTTIDAVKILLKLKNNKSLIDDLGIKNYEVYKKFFTINKMSEKYKRLYLSVSDEK